LLIKLTIDRLKPLNEGKIDIAANCDSKEILNLLLQLDALSRIYKGLSVWLEAEYLDSTHV